ncbi:Polysulfide reductase, NrfD [Thioalkalivibrio nitratireducens DSM 14787]|uniref:Polysulfide reductase, NrfD n=1 Tax=Thioalkalivibrio nitratireducens (strain DSM 14787 / UNIQEM 213 / ALEN2) TaxID=1255043 RepID=L0DSP3_THIND|nr:NrfD/PsrC family molybdoenzyme membrane anchor subunit [Thioalkalivibrio nitratireducens]AGA32634.1 Polysulfide reductase, NrfD [Thioalkalivibrio nitratireducens DSM 14787]
MSNEAVLQDAPRGGGMPILTLLIALIAIGLGVYTSLPLFSEGHAAFNTSSNVVWGLPVVAYVFLALSSTGLAMVSSLAMVFGWKDFYPIAKRCLWLAVTVLIAGFISLALELGHPFRMLWAIPLNLQIQSPLFWMGVWYLIALIFMIVKLALLHRDEWSTSRSRTVGIATFVSESLAAVTLALVFGMMAMRPYWYGSFVPVYFLVTAALSGVAFATLFAFFAHRLGTTSMSARMKHLMTDLMPKIFAALLGTVLVLAVARVITGLWSNQPEISLVTRHFVDSPWFHVQLWLGMVLPFILLLMPKLRVQPLIQVLASVLVLLGVFIGRYEYIVGGQLIPLWKGTWYPDLIAYTPSLTEWGIVIFGVGVGLLIYAVGTWMFRLDDAPADAR